MSSLSQKDRVSLCMFSFADGRRCRTPRVRNHPHFCFDHAPQEAPPRATESLGKDLAYFFSGDYLSACDLSTALARLVPAVVRGDVKPRTARTVAYLAQTLLQTIHISQHEYCEAFGPDTWRKSILNSVKGNHTYRFPPAPKPEKSESPQPPVVAGLKTGPGKAPQPSQPQPQSAQGPLDCHSERSEESASSSNSSLATHHSPLPQPLPPTSAEFAQHVVAGLPLSVRPGSTGKTGEVQAPKPAPAQTPSPVPSPPTPDPAPSPASAGAPQTPGAHTAPSYPACHPERSEGSRPIPATQFARPAAPAVQPNNPPPAASPGPKPVLPLDSRALHFDHNCRLLIDGKPV